MQSPRRAPDRQTASGAASRTLAGLLVPALLALSAAAIPSTAQAARETDVVPMLHGEAGIDFRGEVIQEQFIRGGNRLGARNQTRTFVDVDARFGVWTGLELYLLTSYDTWDRVQWQDVNLAAPNGGFAGSNGGDFVERRKGFADVWVGGKYAILSESRGTGDVSSWTIESSVKIPGSFKIYPSTSPTAAESPAGTPGYELLLKTSFSHRVRFIDPYITFFYLNRGSATSTGEGVGTYGLADQWGTFFGTEIIGFERKADDLKFSADIGIGWRWVNDGQTPANRFLYGPDGDTAAAPAGFNNVVREQGYVQYDSRVGFFYQLQKHARATGHVTFAVPGEHQLEIYPDNFTDPQAGSKIRNKINTNFGYTLGFTGIF
jgi:hypothetical protein